MRQSGEAVVQSLGMTGPLRVLDLGCGDGTTAIPLAFLGAEVVGIDVARYLVEAGTKRAAEAGLTRLKFQEGDACDLQGVGDRSFDLTLSMFGAMFAPKPVEVAKEMVRVTKQGGRMVMGNWIPNDPTVSQLRSQLCVHASASGRVRQSHGLGCGLARHRPLWPGRRLTDIDGRGRISLCFARPGSGRVCRTLEAILRPNDERL
jgi:SAM-dependent methyltransferase